jgi:hypothetical protein
VDLLTCAEGEKCRAGCHAGPWFANGSAVSSRQTPASTSPSPWSMVKLGARWRGGKSLNVVRNSSVAYRFEWFEAAPMPDHLPLTDASGGVWTRTLWSVYANGCARRSHRHAQAGRVYCLPRSAQPKACGSPGSTLRPHRSIRRRYWPLQASRCHRSRTDRRLVPALFTRCFSVVPRLFFWCEGSPLRPNGRARRPAEFEPDPQGSRSGSIGAYPLRPAHDELGQVVKRRREWGRWRQVEPDPGGVEMGLLVVVCRSPR